MPYVSRTGGPQRYRQDPSANGIFIHGGTCLMHGRNDPFKHSAMPNNFDLTLPSVDGQRDIYLPWPRPRLATFSQAVAYAETIRREHPSLSHAPIYACTDLIHDNPWSARTQVQLVSHRLARRQSAALKVTA